MAFLPPMKIGVKYVPPKEDVLRVIMAADSDTQDYLYAIRETLGRMGEINRLTWNDETNYSKRDWLLLRLSIASSSFERYLASPGNGGA